MTYTLTDRQVATIWAALNNRECLLLDRMSCANQRRIVHELDDVRHTLVEQMPTPLVQALATGEGLT